VLQVKQELREKQELRDKQGLRVPKVKLVQLVLRA
jgi:hypothetical protein